MGDLVSGWVRSTIGTANASVLPEPVRDLASTSRPAIASAITRDWIAKGASMPRIFSASTTGRETPSASKVVVPAPRSVRGSR